MIEIQTKKNTVKVFTEELDKQTKLQIAATARDPAYADSKIRVMPDTHAGRGCVIGMTMTLKGRVSPSLVGVDIGCGMEVVRLEQREIDLTALDTFIHEHIPAGRRIHDDPIITELPLRDLHCIQAVDADRILRSLGTLGGGNHFIEVDRGSDGSLYLVIHSGSRSLGAVIANHYRDEAYKYHLKKARKAHRVESRDRMDMETDRYDLTRFGIDAYGDDAHAHRPQATKASRRDERGKLPVKWETAACEGQLYEDYLHDLGIAVAFAEENRRRIAERICEGLGLIVKERFSCVHNYIDTDRILRKGAISARLGERVFIPLNMRDGALIGVGLGNPDWNFSAPHGAGRACSRTDAKHAYDLEAYQATMREAGVYTTTATKETLDECPMAYKSPDRILPYLADCVEVTDRLIPIYNFKASE
ncbi:MAG: RtcB family protein [Clostridia bacterium]|nr:RtcB family protein [Clostridia bacterium]